MPAVLAPGDAAVPVRVVGVGDSLVAYLPLLIISLWVLLQDDTELNCWVVRDGCSFLRFTVRASHKMLKNLLLTTALPFCKASLHRTGERFVTTQVEKRNKQALEDCADRGQPGTLVVLMAVETARVHIIHATSARVSVVLERKSRLLAQATHHGSNRFFPSLNQNTAPA
jgi:hypothetical protein